jgi:transposase-like protein
MTTCPKCTATSKQRKIGRTKSGSQRYQCQACGRRYTPEPKVPGYDEEIRLQAVRLYADGMNFRRIGRQLGVSHQSVINWVNAYSAQWPAQPPQPKESGVVEMDELFSFIGEKETGLSDDVGRPA